MNDLTNLPASPADLDAYEVEHLFHSWSYQPDQPPPRVVSARGVRFTTVDGRERLDFSSCFVSRNIGHQDPRVVAAIKAQADELCSFAPTFSTRPRALLSRMLAEITPGDLSRSFLSLGGTEANEAAIKICHQYTGRRKMLTRYRTYQQDNLIDNSREMGAYLLERARELQDRHPCVGDVRGLGLFVGLELVKNRATREPIMPVDAKIKKGPNPKLAVAKRLGELGMMAMAANPGNVIAKAPPLIVTRDAIDEGIAIMDQALEAADAFTEG